MRIRSLRIDSYGKVRDREFSLSPGLTVFHGPNESGKSTTMDFIRSALSPTKKTSYPERNKTDTGTIVYEEGGAEKRVRIEGKTGNAGDVPVCMEGMDPVLYRGIFAMTREGLDEMSPLSNGSIRTRFLTIPGGESIPDVIDSIDADRDMLIGKTANSPAEIIRIARSETDLQTRIAALRSHAERYSELSGRKAELEARLSEIREANRSAEAGNSEYAKIQSMKASFANLADLRRKRNELAGRPMAGKDAEDTYKRLCEEKSNAESAYRALDDSRKQQIASLPGGDERRMLAFRPRVQSVLDRQQRYRLELSKPTSQPVTKSRGKVRIAAVAVFLLMAVAVCVVPGLDAMAKAVAASVLVAGAGLSFFLIKDVQTYAPVRDDGWARSYEAEVEALVTEMGMAPSDTYTDLRKLSGALNTLEALDLTRGNCAELRLSATSADNRLVGFLAPYGGIEGYRQAVRNRSDFDECGSKIDALAETIRGSGLDPDKPLPVVERREVDTSEQESVSADIGRLTSEMRAALDTGELDSLIDQSYALTARKEKGLREGATAILAAAIVQNACSDLYETVHPDVITTADRYLSMMTLGTCRFDLDPRNPDLTVVSNGEPKGAKQWSTGLHAQIMLSIKLAIAKEMGNGEIPVILDDVLLPFDRERKNGACMALSALSQEMQVLLFTCDDDVMGMCGNLPNTSVISM